MDLGLTGRVFIVTGGYSGIGEAIVREAAAEGAVPVIVGRSGERGKNLEAELRGRGYECLAVQAELAQPSECQKTVAETLARYGRIDGLVNNAGLNDGVGLENGDPERFLESIRQNVYHYYCMAHYALEALKKSRGNIVNVSSKTAVTGQGGTSAYVVSKAGQLGLAREWAVELLPYGIRVNAVVPAEVWTPLYERWVNTFPNPEEKLAGITKNIPLGRRMTTSQEIAWATLFLLSDRAAHITGQHWFVDGGYTHLDRAI
ncbi:MAG: SDR family oxidoreductase [Bernardetiaceae bacterium]|jgi:L-fucose dehydrogenase|nr:SDR family oxidoreductase [Bernardetiaceae bacterium]